MKNILITFIGLLGLLSMGAGFSVDEDIDAFSGGSVEETVYSPTELVNFGLELHYFPVSFERLSGAFPTNARSGHAVQILFEFLPFDDSFGKLGLGLKLAGCYLPDVVSVSGKRYSMGIFPFGVYLGYRLEYFENQLVVPYGKVGPGVALVSRDPSFNDQSARPWYYGLDYGFGIEVFLNPIDRVSSSKLSHSVGIRRTYLIAEVSRSVFMGSMMQPDLRHDEIHVGLRFEL